MTLMQKRSYCELCDYTTWTVWTLITNTRNMASGLCSILCAYSYGLLLNQHMDCGNFECSIFQGFIVSYYGCHKLY